MTCEVAVMNRRGVALAADSAITLGEGRKIYHTAEKLFPISFNLPVGIMTFGAAELMDAPWETVIKMYARKFGDRPFDTLEEYALAFLGFIEASTSLFPPAKQAEHVTYLVTAIWGAYRAEYDEKIKGVQNPTETERAAVLTKIVAKDHARFREYPQTASGSEIAGLVERTYAQELQKAEGEVFQGITLSAEIRKQLQTSIWDMYSRDWVHPAFASGVVIAGMGEEEAFPVLLEYRIGTIAAGKLLYSKREHSRIGVDSDAIITPFAQRETIDTIIDGIHPEIRNSILENVVDLVSTGKSSKGISKAQAENFARGLSNYVQEKHAGPLMDAVSALPRQDLAKMAEALVSLTAFVMRMTADCDETVAEPIDVALLSKGDGFTWVKHKDLIEHAGLA